MKSLSDYWFLTNTARKTVISLRIVYDGFCKYKTGGFIVELFDSLKFKVVRRNIKIVFLKQQILES